jgi:hypothetical protein
LRNVWRAWLRGFRCMHDLCMKRQHVFTTQVRWYQSGVWRGAGGSVYRQVSAPQRRWRNTHHRHRHCQWRCGRERGGRASVLCCSTPRGLLPRRHVPNATAVRSQSRLLLLAAAAQPSEPALVRSLVERPFPAVTRSLARPSAANPAITTGQLHRESLPDGGCSGARPAWCPHRWHNASRVLRRLRRQLGV